MKSYKWGAGLLALSLGAALSFAGPANAEPGDGPQDPIIVSSPDDVPAGAVEDEVSTYSTPQACDTTRSWVLTVPATDDTSHQEFRYLKVVPGQYHEAVTHEESKYTREVPGQHHDAVTHEEYHFSKYTHTKTRTYTQGTPAGPNLWWNWSPNNTHGPQNYTPAFPTDARGTWEGPHENGGPSQSTFGTFQSGFGNSSYFHREHGTPAVAGGWSEWTEYGPWTQWTPVTHESWELSDAPLGSPEFHGSGQDGNVQWYREWQAQFDGGTRTVTDTEAYDDPSTTETTDWLISPPEGEGWTIVDTRTVTDQAAYTDPDVTLYYVLGGEPSSNAGDASWLLAEQAPEGWTQFDERTVSNEDGTPEVITYYAYTDGAECDKPEGYKHTDSTEKCVNGDLVTTETTETGTPVQADDGSWTLEETATSSQSVEKDALKCAPTPPHNNPPHHNPPADTPVVPTVVHAGL